MIRILPLLMVDDDLVAGPPTVRNLGTSSVVTLLIRVEPRWDTDTGGAIDSVGMSVSRRLNEDCP